MVRTLYITWSLVSALLAWPMLCPVHAAQADKGSSVSTRLLSLHNEMWFLLSGVVDKDTADAAAPRFRELAENSSKLSDELFGSDAQGLDVEALDQDTYRIAELYEDVSYEFESLCRAHCYDSDALTSAFLLAMRLGVFGDDCADLLQLSSTCLSPLDAQAEIDRLISLESPDRELLRVLSTVKDAPSARAAVPALAHVFQSLHHRLPQLRLKKSNFPAAEQEHLSRACSKLEPLLWKIRSEIVRIVSLPGYDGDPFDSFSDALDTVFECLGNTHAECFDEVFDESFRSDLDDALHESVTASN